MATGQRIAAFLRAPTPGLTTGMSRTGVTGFTRTPRFAVAPNQGSFSQLRPHAVRSVSFAAAQTGSYFDDYYKRIHIIPKALDFGAISGEVAAVAIVWNAWLKPLALTSVVTENADGVSVTGPMPTYNAKPLEMLRYAVKVSGDGSPSVDVAFTFAFANGNSASLPVTAVRARFWPYPPNWGSGFNVKVEYRTEMTVSRSGLERRRALRQSPRKSVEFTSVVAGNDLRDFNRLMLTWQNRTFFMPELPKRVTATTEMSGDSLTMGVDTTPDWLVAGQTVIITDGQVDDLRRVASVIGNIVTFASKSPHDWSIGTRLHPALEGLVSAETVATGLTNSVATVAVTFDVHPTSEAVPSSGSADAMFNGREVFLRKPNWAQPVETTHAFPSDVVDYGYGTIRRYRPIDFQTRYRKAVFLGRDAADVDRIEAFFRRMKGQRGEFYMPTGENDLPLVAAALVDSNILRVAGPGIARDWSNDRVNRVLTIQFRDGRRLFARATSIATVEDQAGHDSIITLTENLPYNFNVDEVLLISWMPLWRHATDSLTIEWVTDSVAQVALALKTLPDAAAE